MSVKSYEDRLEQIKNWRDEHIAEGLCRYCNNEAVQGKTMCNYHLEYMRKRRKLYK